MSFSEQWVIQQPLGPGLLSDRLVGISGLGERPAYVADGSYQYESAHYQRCAPKHGGDDSRKGMMLAFYDVSIMLGCVHTNLCTIEGWGLTAQQFKIIENLLTVPRGNVKISNLKILNPVVEHGYKWRGLLKKFGRWHSIYMPANRWAKQSVLNRVFQVLQENDVINIQVDQISLDSAIVKVHPDGTGVLNKRSSIYRQVAREPGNPNSYGRSWPLPRRSIFSISAQVADAPEGRKLLKSLENCGWEGTKGTMDKAYECAETR